MALAKKKPNHGLMATDFPKPIQPKFKEQGDYILGLDILSTKLLKLTMHPKLHKLPI